MHGSRRAVHLPLVLAVVISGLLGPAGVGAQGAPALNTLYNFTGADGSAFELPALLQASDGDFYGVSASGGAWNFGYVYKISRATGQIQHLHDFNFSDGATPRGPLIQASDGFLYGTTEAGGAHQSDYCYVGSFYGKSGCGTVFRISLTGVFTKLHDFYSADDGYMASPGTGVIQASDGNFYGAATRSYPSSTTAIFKMTPDGTVSIHYLFATSWNQGFLPYAGMIQATDGKLYGTTASGGLWGGGTIFRVSLGGQFESLHSFRGAPSNTIGDGSTPWAKLLQAQDGNFYGTTRWGGNATGGCLEGGCGTVFRMTPAGTVTILHAFTGTAADGEYPEGAGVVQTPDGVLYGVTGGNPYAEGYEVPLCVVGGSTAFSCGTLYKLDTAGTFTQLRIFADGNGSYGLFPHASLTLASDGNLYGTTFAGGGWGYGTVYRVLLDPATPVVAISGFSPAGGPPGTTVVLTGTGFTGTTEVTFPGGGTTITASYTVDSDSQITTVVPVGAQSGAIGITAPRGTTYANTNFYLTPVINSITPRFGRAGSSVTLLGAHFDGITSITFGGTPASKWGYVTSDDTAIVVTVPFGARTGPIVVTNPGGSGASGTFFVLGR